VDAQEELLRIDKYKEYKKLNTDTFLFTSKLFEQMARNNPLNNNEKEGESSSKNELVNRQNVPFKGLGIMQFDDYNYSVLNKVIFNL